MIGVVIIVIFKEVSCAVLVAGAEMGVFAEDCERDRLN
jgi:hypothetical protein